MGLLNRLLGNSTETDISKVEEKLNDLLCEGEQVLGAYRLIRDLLVLTDSRLIFVDKKGITGKRTLFVSIPYQQVVRFSVETAGHLDIDSELRIWLCHSAEPLVWEFGSSKQAVAAQRQIAAGTFRR
jgi:hypothetical protein